MARALAWSAGVLATAFLLALPLWANNGVVFLVGVTLIEALFALSWNMLFGFTGLATFGHAAFFGMGAYLVAVLLKQAPDVSFLGMLIGSAALGAVSAAVVGLIALRRTGGIQLAILTLAMSEVLHIFIGYSTLLGGADGLSAIPRPRLGIGPLSVDLAGSAAYFWFLCAACGGLAALLWWVVRSRYGRMLRAIRQDPARAAFLGVDVAARRLGVFVLSGAVAAVAGGLSAPWTQIVTPGAAGWVHSTQPILGALLGGATMFWGPVVGTAVFAVIQFETRTIPGVSEIVIGGVLLLVILAAPEGLLGLLREAVGRWHAKRLVRARPESRVRARRAMP